MLLGESCKSNPWPIIITHWKIRDIAWIDNCYNNQILKGKMQPRQVNQEDILTNLLIKSKGLIEDAITSDHKLNYNKMYNNPKEYEISYVDALANLEEINQLFRKRINDKNKHYNFFLDDSEDPSIENPISVELYDQYQEFLKRGEMFCYTTKNTWTKGKEFFFVQKGTVMKIVKIYEDRVFADLSYHDKVGLMKLSDLKIIMSNGDIQQ